VLVYKNTLQIKKLFIFTFSIRPEYSEREKVACRILTAGQQTPRILKAGRNRTNLQGKY